VLAWGITGKELDIPSYDGKAAPLHLVDEEGGDERGCYQREKQNKQGTQLRMHV
jgi:hypothetical protein